MNYYDHHIGDYAEATSHLSFVEDAAYGRLIRKYYSTEKPLPKEISKVQRLVGAKTKEEKIAVSTVLEEFFILEEDGWHNKRCDEEIKKYLEGSADRLLKEEHEKERMRRYREERARLFAELREHGVTPKWDIKYEQLKEIYERTCTQPVPSTGQVQEQGCTAPATANQYPIPNTQYPIPNIYTKPSPPSVDLEPEQKNGGGGEFFGNKAPMPEPEAPEPDKSAVVQMAIALRKQAVEVTAVNPVLISWIERGVTMLQANEAILLARKSKPPPETIHFNYLNTVLCNMLKPPVGVPGPLPEIKKWHESASGIEAKGKELGVNKVDGEPFPMYRNRVFQAVKATKAVHA